MSTGIKICGITRVADAEAVVAAGADALGLNFAPVSPRQIEVSRAREISEAVAGAVLRVGLFVDADTGDVARVLDAVDLDVLQFHGAEPADFCRQFGLPYMKVFRVEEPFDLASAHARYPDACCLLLDAFVPGVHGGTGKRLEPAFWPTSPGEVRLVLAGGLNPANVREAVERLKPYAVDVSGGVETERKGEKDPARIRQFVEEVRSAGR